MQDEKLARGLAREVLRKVKVLTRPEDGLIRSITADLTALYIGANGPTNVVSAGLALRDRFPVSAGFQASTHIIKHPIHKRVLVETMSPVVIPGGEQEWLACQATLFDVGRHELGVVETSGHIALSHHALARLFQRSNFAASQLAMLLDVTTNFTSPLVRVAVDSSCRPGHQVAIPFADGLLLGSIEADFHEEGQGPSFQTVTRSGIWPMTMLDCPHLISAQHRCTLKISIHTFVGAHDLFPNQCVIRDSLTAFGSHHQGAMRAIRTALFRGFPDPRMIQRFGAIADGLAPEGFDELAETMQNFFDTPEWHQQAEAHMRTERYVH